jgi:fructose-bisphosphate aldolase class II
MPNDKMQANISGAISGAMHIHNVAKYYGVPVIIHTDHAAKKWLPWISALIDAGEQFYKEKKQPLFSSHMLDLSEEPIEENIETSVQFYKRMKPLGMSIEIELGVTGGEEDGVDNSGIENDKLYTQPEHVAYAYEELGKVGNLFTVAAASSVALIVLLPVQLTAGKANSFSLASLYKASNSLPNKTPGLYFFIFLMEI